MWRIASREQSLSTINLMFVLYYMLFSKKIDLRKFLIFWFSCKRNKDNFDREVRSLLDFSFRQNRLYRFLHHDKLRFLSFKNLEMMIGLFYHLCPMRLFNATLCCTGMSRYLYMFHKLINHFIKIIL